MKYIEIREITNSTGEVFEIQIVNQTHKCTEFGKCGRTFTSSNNFVLQSYDFPELDVMNVKGLFVRGSWEHNDLKKVKVMSTEWLCKLREAVAEYNEFFSNCGLCKERHCNECKIKKEVMGINNNS